MRSIVVNYPPLKGRACKKCSTLTRLSGSYVTRKYIGTSGYFTSPGHCGWWLNKRNGLNQCCQQKLRDNFVKVTFTRETEEREVTPKLGAFWDFDAVASNLAEGHPFSSSP